MKDCWGSRIWLIGPAGAGKTTLARALCARLGSPHVELDRFFWLPGWKRASDREFQAAVAQIAAQEKWIIDGQYDIAHVVLRERTDMVIWLDVAATVAFGRLVRRTTHRLISREELWNANRERFTGAIQLLSWALREHPRVRRRNEALGAFLAQKHTPCVRIRSGAELQELLSTLE